MKAIRICLIAAVLSTLSISATVQGQTSGVFLDDIRGSWEYTPDTRLCTGTMVIFRLRLVNNTGSTIEAYSHGFRIYSPTGGQWTTAVGKYSEAVDPGWFPILFNTLTWGTTGSGADTVSFGGVGTFGAGIPDGFDDFAFLVAIGPIPDTDAGHTYCIDSSWVPPGGNWNWSNPSVQSPAWGGPYCFEAGIIPCLDDDGDGVYTGCDNCGDVYNPDQADDDLDGIGNACDHDYCCQYRGDIDGNGSGPDIADLVAAVGFMFQSEGIPCIGNADVDNTGQQLDISDLVYLVAYMFQSGPAPVLCPSQAAGCK